MSSWRGDAGFHEEDERRGSTPCGSSKLHDFSYVGCTRMAPAMVVDNAMVVSSMVGTCMATAIIDRTTLVHYHVV